MEISFSVHSLSRKGDGTSKVSVMASAVIGTDVLNGQTIFSEYIEVPHAEEHFSVESYIVKVLFNLSIAMQEAGDRKGQTPTVKLMLDQIEH